MNIKTFITTEKIDWSVLIISLLESLTLNRYELALKLGVTEQAVSNWTTGHWNPGSYYRRKIFELLEGSELNINDYLKDNLQKNKIHNPTVRLQPAILDFSKKVHGLPMPLRNKILKMADQVIKGRRKA